AFRRNCGCMGGRETFASFNTSSAKPPSWRMGRYWKDFILFPCLRSKRIVPLRLETEANRAGNGETRPGARWPTRLGTRAARRSHWGSPGRPCMPGSQPTDEPIVGRRDDYSLVRIDHCRSFQSNDFDALHRLVPASKKIRAEFRFRLANV